ncbi:hypothetical protein A5819_003719, partial [Enterococcus sp. 7E2_DIV0204]
LMLLTRIKCIFRIKKLYPSF